MNYSKHNLSDTIVALATPPGVGAIGVIRLSGADAIAIANKVFFGKNLEKQKTHTIHFGTIRNVPPAPQRGDSRPELPPLGGGGDIIDEVLASIFVAPKSYTKENVVEFSCHGSPYIQQQIIQLLLKHGARMAQAGEFTLRAFMNGQLDLSQAEAVADLIASSSASSHHLAMQQMRGGFSNEIKILRGQLINFASLIELELDFGEEDVEFANRDALRDLVTDIQQLIKKLLDSFALGNVLKNGVSTVIAGRPNAGKSTLLNALLNEERAIVSEIAGTTRDTIEEVLNINGIEFRLIDTAGLREATDKIEAIGVQRTMEKVRDAALLVYLFDVAETSLKEVHADLKELAPTGLSLLVVCNKMDKLNDELRMMNDEWLNEMRDDSSFIIHHSSFITISAKNGQNIDWLKENLVRSVVEGGLNIESTIVSNARHFEALQKSYASLDDVLRGIADGITTDFVAMDIRRALHYLGEITGDVGVDDLLDNIFSKFCIGK